LGLIVTASDNALYRELRDLDLPVRISQSSTDIASALDESFDLGILAWWPKIIHAPLIAKPKQGFMNTHPSFLPFNRGKHYNFWAIVEGAPFGVTLHRIDDGVDTGPIVAQREITYDWTDTGESLFFKARNEMIDLFCQTYPKIRSNAIGASPQNLVDGSFHKAAELDRESRIELNQFYKARDLLNLLRARTFEGHPGCFFYENGECFEVRVSITRKEK
jgi:methionyl-tRNA formyltransferase